MKSRAANAAFFFFGFWYEGGEIKKGKMGKEMPLKKAWFESTKGLRR